MVLGREPDCFVVLFIVSGITGHFAFKAHPRVARGETIHSRQGGGSSRRLVKNQNR